jgi:hypothetical protein
MHMLWILVDTEHRVAVEAILRQGGATGFSEIGPVVGMGTGRPRFASAAFPESSTLLMSWLEPSCLEPLIRALDEYRDRARCHLYALSWPVEIRLAAP